MIRRIALAFCLVAVGFSSSRAEAASGLRASFGQSIYLVPPPTLTQAPGCYPCWDGNRRQPLDIEIMPYFNFGMISLDLAVLFQLEQRSAMGFIAQFRPGIRVFPFMGFYVRASIPLTAANLSAGTAYFQFNLSVGGGYELRLSNWGVFAEFNLNPSLRAPFNMPIEFRLGVSLQTN